MALKDLHTDLSKILKPGSAGYNTARDLVGKTEFHTMEINPAYLGSISKDATKEAIIEQGGSNGTEVLYKLMKDIPEAFSNKTWEKLAKDAIKNAVLKHTYATQLKGGVIQIAPGNEVRKSEVNYTQFAEWIRRELFDTWQKKFKKVSGQAKVGPASGIPRQLFEKGEKSGYKYDSEGNPKEFSGKEGPGSRITHMEQSVYEAYLKIKAREFFVPFAAEVKKYNVMDLLMKNLQVEMQEDR